MLFAIYRTRLWPQCLVTVVDASDLYDAFMLAKRSGVLNPIVGRVDADETKKD